MSKKNISASCNRSVHTFFQKIAFFNKVINKIIKRKTNMEWHAVISNIHNDANLEVNSDNSGHESLRGAQRIILLVGPNPFPDMVQG